MLFGAAAVTLIFINGFFVLAEYALVHSRKTKLAEPAEQGDAKAQAALAVLDKQDAYLSSIQLGITASSVLLGLVCVPLFRLLFALVGIEATWGCWLPAYLSVVVAHVVFAELVPRTVALNKIEESAMAMAYPVTFFYYLTYPLMLFCHRFSRAVLRLLGFSRPKEDLSVSEDELREIVSASGQEGEIDPLESSMIENVFDFSERVVKEIMVPRQDMHCLFVEDSLADNLQEVRTWGKTRYPLCEEDKDHVIGVIHVRDLVEVSSQSDFDLRKAARPMVAVPEAMPVAKLLQLMQKEKVQIALVADEYGGTAGLITMEDLVEEIVGEIEDRGQGEQPEAEAIAVLPDGGYEFDGLVLLDDIAELLHIEFADAEEDTIGGYVFGCLGRKPQKKDQVTIGGYVFTVLQAEGFRVLRVAAHPLPPA